MSYTALYRKFRPADFSDVQGQDHIVVTLKNQLRTGRIGHAYLFTGTRGTGKTSVAKIMAKAVNCEDPTENGPCNECAMCKAIAAQASLNVVELDAASNNGVDNIREIIEEVQYSPAEGRFKVYIIDEVHMLSTGAFNALLKTLEEPPSYVIFILATTEVHKIPITILSRCQRYDFHRISIDTIYGHLKKLTDKEGVNAEEKALKYIAKCADGSMRDGLSILDQCIAFYLGEELTYDRVLQVVGAVDTEVFYRLFRSVKSGDIKNALMIIEEVIQNGRELTWFVSEMVWYMRNLLIAATSPDDCEDMVDMSEDNFKLLKEQSDTASPDEIIRYIRVFSELSSQIKYSSQKRVLCEIAIIRLCRPQMETDITSVKERVRRLEFEIQNGVKTGIEVQDNNEEKKDVKPDYAFVPALPDDIKNVAENWSDIVASLEPALQNTVRSMTLSISEGDSPSLLIVSPNNALTMILESEVFYRQLCDAVNAFAGKEVPIAVKHIDKTSDAQGLYPNIELLVKNGVEITYE